MRRPHAIVSGLVMLLFLGAGPLPSGTRAADATFEPTTIENGYPKALTFKLNASAPVEIKDVTLSYTLGGNRTTSLVKPDPAEFTPGTKVSVAVKVDTNPNTNWLPVGNELTWHWELTLADGTVSKSREDSYLYLPVGKDWKTAKNEIAIVYYTGSLESRANQFLAAMQSTYETHGKTLLKTELARKPVKLLLLADNKEINDASPSKGTTLDSSRVVVTCGFRPGNANDLIFAAISCGGDPTDTIRHEFGHILNAAAGEGTLVKLPLWLDEGLAVYAQAKQDDYTAAFQAASRRQTLIPFRDMATPIGDQNQIILQYGQSFMMTKYLIDKYGADKLNAMLALTKKDTRFDVALKQTYNFDISGFETEFKAAGGSGGSSPPTVAPTVQPQQQQPTRAAATAAPRQAATPTAAAASSNSVTTADSGGVSRTTVVLVGIAVILLLCAVFAFLISMFLQNSRGTGGAA